MSPYLEILYIFSLGVLKKKLFPRPCNAAYSDFYLNMVMHTHLSRKVTFPEVDKVVSYGVNTQNQSWHRQTLEEFTVYSQ